MTRWFARIALAAVLALLWPASPAAAYEPPGADAWRTAVPALDPATASPDEVAAYFASLSPEDAGRLAAEFPGVVGNLDGAPIALRYRANGGEGLLALDERQDGRIVRVVGDLATAERIAVIVPGMSNTLANFYDGQGGVLRRSPLWQAEQLKAAANDPGLAVVAWLGYDSPENGLGIMSTVRSGRAETGGEALARFTKGLHAVRPEATISVLGHSYGTIVIAYAAPDFGPEVTDLIVVGSPGMDVGSAAELDTTARLWAGRAGDDPIANIPDVRILGFGHGVDPTDAGFGALPLDTSGIHGHDHYFEGASLRGMAAIAAGHGSAA
ncbi:hypothetical protein Afil01_22420 [Actinorhabdospora filicis]|uniref:DUF1023 domain-containing protein n=1 Tax=Actinorhabdospora filicis TaxID=1785913 RepID=A0A9W6WAA3_9ACTN|nr:alpha/beta hydrolase [Actinorhabdospora filicis]GLZ77435.1 hypothetical protein Afil01_22420 [Actinorhabdospora filicis]